MKRSGKKETTIDDLAVMVAKGFSAVDKRFEIVDKKFEIIDKKLIDLDDSIKATRQDVLRVGDRFVPRYEFDTLLSRVIRIEQKLQGKSK